MTRWMVLFTFGLAACAGCTQVPDLGCVVASDNCIAWRNPDGSLQGYMETVAGQQYVAGTTEGKDWACVEVSGWTKDEWCAARESLGVPPEVCVWSPRGERRCAPCSAVESPTWGSIKALYR